MSTSKDRIGLDKGDSYVDWLVGRHGGIVERPQEDQDTDDDGCHRGDPYEKVSSRVLRGLIDFDPVMGLHFRPPLLIEHEDRRINGFEHIQVRDGVRLADHLIDLVERHVPPFSAIGGDVIARVSMIGSRIRANR